MKKFFMPIAVAVLAIVMVNCSSDDDNSTSTTAVTKKAVIENYANIVYQSYKDSYDRAVDLQTAVNAFVANPSETTHAAAKSAWFAAREIYGQTEAYRESSGPIDSESLINNEGQLNAWPIDEGYVDYVASGTEPYAGTYTSIISDASITINQATIIGKNENVNDKSISTGWHAIEFLLWGQDNTAPSANMPGQRSYTDYTSSAVDYQRRGLYLKTATDLLVSDLQTLVNTWAVGGSYRTTFENLPEDEALKNMIHGAFFIAGEELSSERMIAPVDSADGINNSGQEDEHSCFADNTHRDVYANAQGVNNVIFGTYGTISGPSFYDLVKLADESQAASLKTASDAMMVKINVIANHAKPFDQLITEENSTPPTGPVMQGVVALQSQATQISAAASAIGINLN